MLNHLFALLARARKGIVVAGVALAAVYIAVDVPRGGEIGEALFPFSLTLTLLAVLLCLTALRRPPAALVRTATDHAFENPPSPVLVLVFTVATPFVTEKVSTTIDRVSNRIDPWWLDILVSVLWVLALLLLVRLIWLGGGVRLRADGVHNLRLAGSLFVPWDALDALVPPATARRFGVTVTYRHPALVRRRGFLRRRTEIAAWNVNSVFLARAIQEYANNPEHRSAIGTEAELGRLGSAIAK